MNYPQLLRHIVTDGEVISPRGREVREVIKTKLVIEPNCNIYAWPKARPIEKIESYLWEELAWYLSGDLQAKHIAKFANLWDKIKNTDGTLNSNYGYLVFYNTTRHPSLGDVCVTPFEWAKACLISDKASRQAVITYNTGGFNFCGNDDYICTQHQAFLIRDNILRCFVALRSSDAIFGLAYNMPWWSLVQQQLWHELREFYPEIMIGNIEVDIYSAHIYAHHYKLVESMIAEEPEQHALLVLKKIKLSTPLERILPKNLEWYRKNIRDFIAINNNQEAADVRTK